MITLHHLEYSQSFRILWLLEELGIEYDLKKYDRDKETHLAPEEYKEISPLGSAPVVTDGDLVLAESNAIVDYILDKHPNSDLRPTIDSPYRNRYLFWFHAAQGSLMPVVLIDALFQIMQKRAPLLFRPFIGPILRTASIRFAHPRVKALLEQAENDLATAPWFGGEKLSAADIVLCYPMEALKQRGYLSDSYPNCQAWIERISRHPSFVKSKEIDGRESIVLPL